MSLGGVNMIRMHCVYVGKMYFRRKTSSFSPSLNSTPVRQVNMEQKRIEGGLKNLNERV